MASGMYTQALEDFMNAAIDLNTDSIRATLVSTSYTFSAAETSMTTAGTNRLGTDDVLTTPTITGGVFDADDGQWTAVAGGSTITGVVIHKFVTNDAGSTPIIYVELTDTATNGGDVTVQWDSGANKIFAFNG
jgi:hypothetical protein